MILLVEEQPELGEPITVYPETTSPLTRELADTGIVNDYAAIGVVVAMLLVVAGIIMMMTKRTRR